MPARSTTPALRPPVRHFAILLTILVVVVGCGSEPGAQSAREFLNDIANGEAPSRYEFEDRSNTAGLTECFGPIASVHGHVDRDTGIAVIWDRNGRPAVYLVDGRALISTRMLPSWDVPTPWLEIGSEVARETLDALMITLGPELGTYVTATELPPTPTDTARAALRAAADVTDLATAEIPTVQSVRVTLTATELQAVFPDETTSRDESLEIDFDIDDERRIVRIAVRQRGVAPRVDGEEGPGWQVRYSGFGAATTATLPPSSEVTTAGNVFTPAEPATFVYDDCEFGA